MLELHIRAVSARNLLDKQTFGRQDPYCKIKVGHKKFKTRVHDNGHKTPYWNEKFVFEVYDPQLDQVHLQVKDKNFTASVLIGETHLPINMFTHGNLVDQWFPLNNHNRYAGEINLRIQLCGPSMGQAVGGVAYAAAAPVAYSTARPAYPQPQAMAYSAPQQVYAPPPQPVYASAPMSQQMPSYPPQPVYTAPPPPVVMAPPPPVVMAPPPVVMAPQPMMMAPATTVVYGGHGHHHHHGYDHHHHHHHGGHSTGAVAMGVGAGLLGGFLLGEALD